MKLVQSETGQKFAAKILRDLPPDLNDRQTDSLLNELNSMKMIRHPNVLSFLKYQENGRYSKKGRVKAVNYILLELCEKGSLFDFIMKNGFMDETLCRFYFRQILEAVEACHASGICHRDIKPENVLFDQEYSLKLSDLGFSISTRGRNGTGYLGSDIGTGSYMAPEIQLGLAYKGEQIDVFSLGVVLFIMRSYNPPFVKASMTDIYYKLLIENEDYFWAICLKNKAADHFSPEFRKLIKGMLAYNPEERWTVRDIKACPWYRGQVSGPLMEISGSSGETLIKVTAPKRRGRARQAAHTVRCYRDFLKIKTTSLFNEDYIIPNILDDEFRFLRYSNICTNLEPNSIISVLNIFFEELKATYPEITPELKVKVACLDPEIEFRLKFFRYEGEIVVYMQKIKGNEFEFIKAFDRLEEIIRDTERYFDELELNIFQ